MGSSTSATTTRNGAAPSPTIRTRPSSSRTAAEPTNPAAIGPTGFPNTVSKVSDGSQSAASFTYNLQPAGFSSRSWEFTVGSSAATAGTTVKVPWTWQGLHAWFQVTTRLEMLVDGSVVQTLVNQGPAICCTSPSNGFIYGGVASFDVPAGAGHTYGFRLSGSNSDFNNFLQGTFTLSTKPYLDATIGTEAVAQTRGRAKDAAGAADVLAHDHHVLVALHLDPQRVVDRLDEVEVTHRGSSAARRGRVRKRAAGPQARARTGARHLPEARPRRLRCLRA